MDKGVDYKCLCLIAFALIHGTFASHVLESMNFRAANRGKDDH